MSVFGAVALARVDGTNIEEEYRLVKVIIYGDQDVRTVDEVAPLGIDSNPIKKSLGVFAESTVSGEAVLLGYISKNRQALPGELRLYGTNDQGEEKSFIWLHGNGVQELRAKNNIQIYSDSYIEIAGDDDNMVRYSKLEAAYNQLKSDHDDVVNDNNNLKTGLAALYAALTTTGSTPLTGTSLAGAVSAALGSYYAQPLSPSTGDITPAKIKEVKTKGG